MKIIFLLAGCLALAVPSICSAAGGADSEIRIFNMNHLVREENFKVSFPGLDEAPRLALVDLGGDGVNEILVGAPASEYPEVKIYRRDGSLVNSFLAYTDTFRGGVSVAAGDIDGDGKMEIVTGAGPGGGPHVRIFDGYGKSKAGNEFFAYDKNFKNGVSVAAGDVNGDGRDEIIVGSGPGTKAEIKIFKNDGTLIDAISPEGINDWSGVRLACGDIDSDGVAEIVAASGWGSSSDVQIFEADGKVAGKFSAYGDGFRGGVNLAVGDVDNDGQNEIVTGAGITGGPHVRVFDRTGKIKNDFFPFDKNSRTGVLVGVGKFGSAGESLVAMPESTGPSGRTDLYKYIEVDISEQKMDFYENGFKLGEQVVSTGTLKMPTPLGDFKIMSKSEVAYSNAYKLYMPNFMLFTKSGAGIHGLPYWKNGQKIVYEGVNHLGKRVSHGCVRLALDAARKIFSWADLNTSVIVHQ